MTNTPKECVPSCTSPNYRLQQSKLQWLEDRHHYYPFSLKLHPQAEMHNHWTFLTSYRNHLAIHSDLPATYVLMQDDVTELCPGNTIVMALHHLVRQCRKNRNNCHQKMVTGES